MIKDKPAAEKKDGRLGRKYLGGDDQYFKREGSSKGGGTRLFQRPIREGARPTRKKTGGNEPKNGCMGDPTQDSREFHGLSGGKGLRKSPYLYVQD